MDQRSSSFREVNMNKVYLKFHTDPGHGWIETPRTLLKKLGILDKITNCSYEKGSSVFLEEDVDASILFKSLKTKGIDFEITEVYSEYPNKIRGYKRLQQRR